MVDEAKGTETEMDGAPRRNRVDQFTPAEKAIYDAMGVVEEAGADVRLTEATVLLDEARASVADFVDGVRPEGGKRTITAEELHAATLAIEAELTSEGPYTCDDLTPEGKPCVACEFAIRLRRHLFGPDAAPEPEGREPTTEPAPLPTWEELCEIAQGTAPAGEGGSVTYRGLNWHQSGAAWKQLTTFVSSLLHAGRTVLVKSMDGSRTERVDPPDDERIGTAVEAWEEMGPESRQQLLDAHIHPIVYRGAPPLWADERTVRLCEEFVRAITQQEGEEE